jgi:hypothetical protein
MMSNDNHKHQEIIGIACSVFKAELEELKKNGAIKFPLCFFDSSLHMRPNDLAKWIAKTCKEKRLSGLRIILIYGDCHPPLAELESVRDIVRVDAVNCCNMILGKITYKRLMKEGAFVILPEWADRWKTIFHSIEGLDDDLRVRMIQDMHSKFVYLNTGVRAIPKDNLEQCSKFYQLPYEVLNVSLDHLSLLIQEAYTKLITNIQREMIT